MLVLFALPKGTMSTSSPSPPILRRILPDLILLPSIALLLSAIMAWANVGFGDEFLASWGRGFLISIVLLPVILACLGVVERGVRAVGGSLPLLAQKLAVTVVTAIFIESMLALAVTLITRSEQITLAAQWWLAFSRSYPAGLAISAFFVFFMKPRMERMRVGAA
jgi:hypothetical protein